MHYLVARRTAAGDAAIPGAGRIVAQGEAIVFEGPWPLHAPLLACVEGATALADIAAANELDGYAVEAIAGPGGGEAFVIAAHRVRDPDGFRHYAGQVAAVVQSFGGRFLARAGKVTALGGPFLPERAVIIEFPAAADAVAFYVSDIYAPLLKIRHATTDPRFVVLARDGAVPAAARATAEDYLRSRRGSAH
jgi:uncharacterized protein (DUF1330 family)